MKLIIFILAVAILLYYKRLNKKYFFSSLVRDEEKTVDDLTGKWFFISEEEQQKEKDCYITLNEDGTFFISGLDPKDLNYVITIKGTYIINKDNNQSTMQKIAKNPENYVWYQVVADVTEKNINNLNSKLAFGMGINKNNTKEMLLCALNAEEVCKWNNLPF